MMPGSRSGRAPIRRRAVFQSLESRRLLSAGFPDPYFGDVGHVVTDIPNGTEGVARVVVLPGGKILAAGDFKPAIGDGQIALVRYNFDGSLDSTFGDNGISLTSFSGGSAGAF